MSVELVVEFNDGAEDQRHEFDHKNHIKIDEGRNFLKIYDDWGTPTFVVAYPSDTVDSMYVE